MGASRVIRRPVLLECVLGKRVTVRAADREEIAALNTRPLVQAVTGLPLIWVDALTTDDVDAILAACGATPNGATI